MNQDSFSELQKSICISSGGQASFLEKNWDTYRITRENREAVQTMHAVSFQDHVGAFLFGPPGVGKSHMLKSKFNELVNWRVQCELEGALVTWKFFWVSLSEYIEKCRHDERFKRKVIESNCLFLDDLGTATTTDWATDQIHQLLDKRLEEKRLTFISSNIPLEEVGTFYNERIKSRITGLCIPIMLKTADQRANSLKANLKKVLGRIKPDKQV